MKTDGRHNLRIIITGGGTGGHLFPGIAMAQAMGRKFPGCELLFIGTERKVDKTALVNLGFQTMSIKSQGIKGKGLLAKGKALLQQPAALWTAVRIIHRFKPDLVFGVGGYVTGPVILAARLQGVPTCIHEQNSIPGLANRILGHIADKIFVSLPGSEKYFPAGKTILSGNPVRDNIIKAAELQKTASGNKPPTLLVLGGSQGARRLNSLMLAAAETSLINLPVPPHIIHQTGEHDENQVGTRYGQLGLSARVGAFFTDMAEIYSQADMVVSRAGATTLAELTVFHKPAILVPYPYAADNHQEINGRYLVEAGAARMFRQDELTGEKLGNEISTMLTDKKLLQAMAEKSGRVAKPGATETIVSACIELLRGRTAGDAGKLLTI